MSQWAAFQLCKGCLNQESLLTFFVIVGEHCVANLSWGKIKKLVDIVT